MSPNKVSEAMINAAHSCLQKYTIDVRFIILPPRKPDDRSELFDVNSIFNWFLTISSRICRLFVIIWAN